MKFSLDELVLQDNRVFAYGWLYDPNARVSLVRLHALLADGTEVILPVTYGKDRQDVANVFPADANARHSGWMTYAAWSGAQAKAFFLAGCLEGGAGFRLPLSLPEALGIAVHTRPGFDVLRGLAKSLIGRIRGKPIVALSQQVKLITPSIDVVSLLRQLLVASGTTRCTLVIDHDMGGGANQFRRNWVEQRLLSCRLILVLGFEVASLDYVLDAFTPDGNERYYLGHHEPASRLVVSGLIEEILYNDAVSFPRPELVPNWLIAFKHTPGVRLIIVVHDYFSICPSQFLLNDSGRFCRVPDVAECLRCLPRNENEFSSLFTSRSMLDWRYRWGGALAVADEIRCFSKSSQLLLNKAFPALDPTTVRIVPHGIAPFERCPKVDITEPLHIGVVGSIGIHKGARVIQELATEIALRGSPVLITIIGSIDLPCNSTVVRTTGVFLHRELPDLIEKSGANIFLLPSICPETFSYVTQELIDMHVPIVTFDFGAPAERVSAYAVGRVLPLNSAAELLDSLMQFHTDINSHAMRENFP